MVVSTYVSSQPDGKYISNTVHVQKHDDIFMSIARNEEKKEGYFISFSNPGTVNSKILNDATIIFHDETIYQLYHTIDKYLFDETREQLESRAEKSAGLITMLEDKISDLESEVLAVDYDNLTSPSGE